MRKRSRLTAERLRELNRVTADVPPLETVSIRAGDRLVLVTDGLIEIR